MAFDLDNEELKATRRDKGLDDRLYEDEINRTANEIATNVGIDFSEAKAAIMQFSMSNKMSDKNVVNIEDDVNKIKEIIKRCEDFNKNLGYESEIYDGDTPFHYKELEYILAERVQDKKRIQELEAENKKLKEVRVEYDYGYELIHFCTKNDLVRIDKNKYLIEIKDGKFIDIKQLYIDSLDSIPKQKVKEILDDIYDYFERLNGPDEDIEYIENKRKELLEDK